MSNPVESTLPNCPTCNLPMMPDASESTVWGVVKTIFHCPACAAEAERVAKGTEPQIQKEPPQISKGASDPQ